MSDPTILIEVELTFNAVKQENFLVRRPTPGDAASEDQDDSRDVNTRYSGRHDHGELPILKSTGLLASIVDDIGIARRACDTYLTNIIVADKAKEELVAEAAAAIDAAAALAKEDNVEKEGTIEMEMDQDAPTTAALKRIRQ